LGWNRGFRTRGAVGGTQLAGEAIEKLGKRADEERWNEGLPRLFSPAQVSLESVDDAVASRQHVSVERVVLHGRLQSSSAKVV
jgi:hypothetical protein